MIQEKKYGNAFEGWLEGPLEFPPTYKFAIGEHAPLTEAP